MNGKLQKILIDSIRFLFFLFLISLIGFPQTFLFGQETGKIQGEVVDAETNQPLPGVNIIVRNTDFGAATDAQGQYVINGVPVGSYSISASMIGYTNVTKQHAVVSLDRITRINFSLSTEALQGQEVVVEAEHSVIHTEVTSSQQIVTEQQMVDAPSIRTVKDFIGKQAGVTDPENLGIRGGSYNQTGTYVNGIEFVNSRFNQAEAGIPLSSIEQISVNTGGFNAEYGNFRSGIINITTKHGSRSGYSGQIRVEGNTPHMKRFGKSIYSPYNYWTRRYMDPSIAFIGTQEAFKDDPYAQKQNPSFVGWNAVAEQFNSGKPPEDQAKPIDLYNWMAWMLMIDPPVDKLKAMGYEYTQQQIEALKAHAHEPEGTNPDWDVDLGFGGPVPLVSKPLGNATFYFSHKSASDHYVQPVSRDGQRDRTTMLTLQSNLTSNLKIQVNGLYKDIRGVYNQWYKTRNLGSGQNFLPVDNLTRFVNGDAVDERYFWYPWFYDPKNTYESMLGITVDDVLSDKTFWRLSVSTVNHLDRSNPLYNRDETILVRFGPIPLDERPYSKSRGNTILDGFAFNEYEQPEGTAYRFSNKGGSIYDHSATQQYQVKWQISSQVNSHNLVKGGLQSNVTKIKNRVWAIRPGHASYDFNYDRQPLYLASYIQDQLTFQGLVANLGVRADYYNADPGGVWPSGDDYSQEAYDANLALNFPGLSNPPDSALAAGRSIVWEWWRQYDKDHPGFLQPIKSHFTLSPRIGFSFPVTENSKYFFNYGQFRSFVPYTQLFRVSFRYGSHGLYDKGNPNLEPPRTISYETGVEYNLLAQYLVRISGYYKNVTGQNDAISYHDNSGLVGYTSWANQQYQNIRGLEISITKNYGKWLSGWLNYNYMFVESGYTGIGTVYQDPTLTETFGRYEGSESRALPRPRFTANITFSTPPNWGPRILGNKVLSGWRVSLLPTWRAGGYFSWNPLGKFHVHDNLQWPDYYVWDAKVSKRVRVGGVSFEGYIDVSNIFNNKVNMMSSGIPFDGSSDQRDYLASLRLPMYDSPEYDQLRQNNPGQYIAGNDKLGMLRSPEHAYINDPNVTMFLFHHPRDIWFGLRVSF